MTATDGLVRAERLSALMSGDQVIGEIIDISGGDCVCQFTEQARLAAVTDGDLGHSFTGQMGSFVKVKVGERWVFGVIRALRSANGGSGSALFAEIDFVGESTASDDGRNRVFQRGITRYPMPGQRFSTASLEDLQQIFSPGDRPHIDIGTVYPAEVVHAALMIDPLLAKHFAILGSTGTGKSSTVALLIHRLVEQAPHGHVLILDPHNEYGRAFRDNGVRLDTESLSIPLWLMNLDEHVEMFVGRINPEREIEADILKRILLAARRKGKSAQQAARMSVDSPVPYHLHDLIGELNAAMGRLEKPGRVTPYLRLKAKIEELRGDPRYAFLFPGVQVNDEMPDILAKLLRFPTEGRPVSILDLSGVPSDIVDVVVSVLARLVFDFAMWSRREGEQPILLLCEEAHRYVPEDTSKGFSAAKRALDRIAKEGRKYGVSLGLISQRPADISESVLSQCGTVIAMRMNNERDQRFVERAMPEGAKGLLAALPSLRNRECLVVGEGIAAPSRIRLATLEEEKRPESGDPEFARAWQGAEVGREYLHAVIRRWRAGQR